MRREPRGRGHCLDPHDCVVSKLIAGRPKDLVFAEALIREQLIDPAVLQERLDLVDELSPVVAHRLRPWLARHPKS